MTSPPSSRPPAWPTRLALIGLVLALIGYSYRETLAAMAEIWWRSDTYAHGFLVPLISGWLAWRARHRLANLAPGVWLLPLLPLAGMVFAWLLGDLTAVNALTQFSVVALIVLACAALLGKTVSRQLAFPLLFLFFAVPIGDFLMPKLMEWTADFTVVALRLSGIPVYREGQNFVVPSGNWSVVEACSGIRYLIASLTVGTLYAYLTYTSLKRRLIFVGISLFVPIVANWLRAYLIVMIGHLSGNKLAVGVDHLIYGWIFFGVVIAIMFAIGARWAETGQAPSSPAAPPPAGPTRPVWLAALLIAGMVSAGPLARGVLQDANDKRTPQLAVPEAVAPWQAMPRFIDLQPQFADPSATLHAAFQNGEQQVGLYIAYYRNQDYDRKLITSTNTLIAPANPEWQLTGTSSTAGAGQALPASIRTYEFSRKFGVSDSRYQAWQWYWINGWLTSSDILAKALTAWSMLSGHGDDSAVVILYAPKAEAERSLSAFSRDMADAIQRTLAEAHAR
ncbi:MAG: exosortase A [Azonexus sp.]